jgi:hypothetical protein
MIGVQRVKALKTYHPRRTLYYEFYIIGRIESTD